MCFSATASFTLFGALVPVGVYTLAKAKATPVDWRLFASFPLAFGAQQGVEGFVWLGLTNGNESMVAIASRGFLFFSHLFWLTWVPLAARSIETDRHRKRILTGLTILGFVYGMSVFLPSFLFADWLYVEQVERSLVYRTTLIYDGLIGRTPLELFYAVIVLSALYLSTHRAIKVFGVLVMISLAVTYLLYAEAFISVWCFFAAILSVYLTVVIVKQAAPSRRGL